MQAETIDSEVQKEYLLRDYEYLDSIGRVIDIDIASCVVIPSNQLLMGNVPCGDNLPNGSQLVAEGRRPSYLTAPILVGLCPHFCEIMQAQGALRFAIPFACGWTMSSEDQNRQSGPTQYRPHKSCEITLRLLMYITAMASAAQTAAQPPLAFDPVAITPSCLMGIKMPSNRDEHAAIGQRFLDHIAAMFPAGSTADSLAVAQVVIDRLSLVVENCPVAPQEGHDGAVPS